MTQIITPDRFSSDKAATCCFTGHRAKTLPLGGDPGSRPMKDLKSWLRLTVQEAFDDGYRTFISGMAGGIDLLGAEEILALRKSAGAGDVSLVCAVPYPMQIEELKTDDQKALYVRILSQSDAAVVVSKAFHGGCYRERNLFMVEHSSRLIGVVRSQKPASGTGMTIKMARDRSLETRIFDLDSEPYRSLYFKPEKDPTE